MHCETQIQLPMFTCSLRRIQFLTSVNCSSSSTWNTVTSNGRRLYMDNGKHKKNTLNSINRNVHFLRAIWGMKAPLFSQSPSAECGSKHSCSDVTHLKTFAFKGILENHHLPHLDEFHNFSELFFFFFVHGLRS